MPEKTHIGQSQGRGHGVAVGESRELRVVTGATERDRLECVRCRALADQVRGLEERAEQQAEALEEATAAKDDATARLLHTRERLSAVLRAIPSGIIIVDGAVGIVMDVNRAALDILGATPEQVIGVPISGFFQDPEHVASTAGTPGPAGAESRETTLIGPGGKVTPVLHNIVQFIVDGEFRALHSVTDIARQKEAEEALQKASMTDALTQLPNRRAFQARIQEEWNRACRHERPLSVIICDVDHFKQYNDTNGHLEGDRCLQKMGEILTGCCQRSTEFAARWGGEEFAVVLSEVNPEEAQERAEVLRRAVEEAGMPRGPDRADPVTISVGLATKVPEVGGTPDGFLDQADEALYQAKEQGRNRVMVAS